MDSEKIEFLKGWLRKASSDLKSAQLLMASEDKDKPYDVVCFHCQQFVEKCIKAFLVYHDIDFPKTHNIARLLTLASLKEPEIRQFDDADKLTYFAVENRYPDDFYMPTNEEAQEALKIAGDLKRFVFSRLPEADWEK
jgi:HEPN domain-containing protein